MEIEVVACVERGNPEVLYRFFPTKNRKKRIEFKSFELDLLRLLYEHRILSLKQLKFYAKEMYNFNPKSLENKLQKWRDNHLVSSEEYGKKTAYYKILKKGLFVLEQTNSLKEGNRLYRGLSVPNQNTDHFFCSRDVVIQSIVEVRKLKKNIQSVIPSSSKYMIDNTLSHVPDWILVGDHGVVNIEIDTGNQTISSTLIDKIENYIKYAEKYPNEVHNVVFVVIDNKHDYFTYMGKYSINPQERVANIKKAVISKNGHRLENLKFYAVSSYRSPYLLANLIMGKNKLDTDERNVEVERILKLMEMSTSMNCKISPLSQEDFYIHNVDQSLYADGHFLLVDEYQRKENILVKLMEEGSARSLDEITSLNQLKRDKLFKIPVHKIFGFYSKENEVTNDSLGTALEYVLFGSKEYLTNHLNVDTPIQFQKVLGPIKRVEVDLT